MSDPSPFTRSQPAPATTAPGGDDIAWSDLGNIAATDDSSFVSSSGLPFASVQTQYLVCDDFDFDLPAGAVIVGLDISYHAWGSSLAPGTTAVVEAFVIQNGTIILTGPGGESVTTTRAAYGGGGATQLFGTTWEAGDVPGVALAANFVDTNDVSPSVFVNEVELTVYYEEPAPGGGVTPGRSTRLLRPSY